MFFYSSPSCSSTLTLKFIETNFSVAERKKERETTNTEKADGEPSERPPRPDKSGQEKRNNKGKRYSKRNEKPVEKKPES